jgi:hypothetical protein
MDDCHAATSSHEVSTPASPTTSRKTSRSLTSTGRPIAIASRTAFDWPSQRDARAKTSASRRISRTSVTGGTSSTILSASRLLTSVESSRCSGPSPTIVSRSGVPSRAVAYDGPYQDAVTFLRNESPDRDVRYRRVRARRASRFDDRSEPVNIDTARNDHDLPVNTEVQARRFAYRFGESHQLRIAY